METYSLSMASVVSLALEFTIDYLLAKIIHLFEICLNGK
jgi:hypothetical protein